MAKKDLENMENLRYLNNKKGNRLDLEPITSLINSESNLLHTTLASIEKSFEDGLAVALVPEGQDAAVGFVRFSPLLGEDLKQQLGLENFPSIWEIGSATLAPEFRGKGLYGPLRNSLLATVSEEMKAGNLLVLGTTKSLAVVKVLGKSKDLGADFEPMVHSEFSMVAPFTCICTPDFGCGFQLTQNCPVRVDKNDLIRLEEIAKESSDGLKIPCVMYVSNRELAQEIDEGLMVKFSQHGRDPQSSLVAALKGAGYYD